MTPIALAIPCLLAVTLGYTLVCWVSPFAACRKCGGFGHQVRTTRTGTVKRGRPCRRCQGTGLRLRIGRRIHNHSARAAAKAQRIRTNANR